MEVMVIEGIQRIEGALRFLGWFRAPRALKAVLPRDLGESAGRWVTSYSEGGSTLPSSPRRRCGVAVTATDVAEIGERRFTRASM